MASASCMKCGIWFASANARELANAVQAHMEASHGKQGDLPHA